MEPIDNQHTQPQQKVHVPAAEKEEVHVPAAEKEEVPVELEVYNQGMFKTELCNKWQESGDCPYKDHCQFAHGVEEQRPVIRHPRYKTEFCRMVLAGAVCPYGHRCHFLHELTEQKVHVPAAEKEEVPVELEVYNQGMFKTELCNKWQESGDCPYKDHCQFAHGVEEQRPVIRHPRYKTEFCRMVLAGSVCPYGHRCHFLHELTEQKVHVPAAEKEEVPVELEVYNQGMFKTELCNKWQESGDCPYKDHCQFAHGVEEQRPVIRHPRYKTEFCRMVLAGSVCPYGHRCHFLHELTEQKVHGPATEKEEVPVELKVYKQRMFKTELCNKWKESGDCPYKYRCKFAHGVEELRPVIRHRLYRSEVCRKVLAGAVCPYGHRCHFIHELTEEEKKLVAGAKRKGKSIR